ncbi:MAG: ABC transporter ATP-binding protein/permease [Clostridiales bacterium]|nr:ABC transporter ATP-binding protein/permease [Clostridiales bacterium]
MLKLIDIKKDYATGASAVHALKGVTLSFRRNEFVSILGASGCGKTTMLNIIGGLDKYTSGDLVINGKSTKDYKDRDWDVYRNHRIGFVFQSYNLIPHQTVLGNVEIALTIAGLPKAERKARATEALKKVGLEKELHKRPNQLSGGQMQRVAIARALVNNPEILLADEPTGALDTETSVQIMDLIREIAGERLVIMVTHNPELAEQYSTRIVKLQDGLVLSDSNPYEGEDYASAQETDAVAEIEETTQEEQAVETEETVETVEAPVKKKKTKKERSAMSFGTSLGLSARNLMSKKGRTTVTSIAGSIGIISVCLVLALSNGFNNFIAKTEEDMLASSPVGVARQTVDVDAIMQGMTGHSDMPKLSELDNQVYINSFLSNIATGMMISNEITPQYVSYLEAMPDDYYEVIQYTYGIEQLQYNMFMHDPHFWELDPSIPQPTVDARVSLYELKNSYGQALIADGKDYADLVDYVDILPDVVSTMPGSMDFDSKDYCDYVMSQYEFIGDGGIDEAGNYDPDGKGRLPKNANEAVFVVGSNNDVTDMTLAQLGIMTAPEFLSLLYADDPDGAPEGFPIVDSIMDQKLPFERLYNAEFLLFNNSALYTPSAAGSEYAFDYHGTQVVETASQDDYHKIKITGILRLKDGLNNGCLNAGLNLTDKLVYDFIQENKTAPIVEYIHQNPTKIPSVNLNNPNFVKSGTLQAVEALGAMGASDEIDRINLYTANFETKKKMLSYLDEWNEMCADGVTYEGLTLSDQYEIKYSDTIGMMMDMVEMMLDAITYVLVAFTSISLVVSSVMIGIITYVSVVERVKEIGVLRSLGARKKDIKNLFNAETFIIGLAAGVLGVAVTYILSLGINVIFSKVAGITNIAALPLPSAVVMILISITLTLISGLIPAKAAAKKDPVVALRTE